MPDHEKGRTAPRRAAQRTTEPSPRATSTEPTPDRPTAAPPAAPSLPAASPRNGVAVNADVVREAFTTGDASLSVGYVQHVLRSRGFEPGNVAGVADHATRVAFARFQESVRHEPTGLPTAEALDYLGFDVIG
jgi:peptidoglycan hydrolase-like protein with peptidoglycan-binding domain